MLQVWIFFYWVYSVSFKFSIFVSVFNERVPCKRNCSHARSQLYEGNRASPFDIMTFLNTSDFQNGISPASVRPNLSKSKSCVVLFSHVIHLTTLFLGSVKQQVIWHGEKAIGALASTTFRFSRNFPILASDLTPAFCSFHV